MLSCFFLLNKLWTIWRQQNRIFSSLYMQQTSTSPLIVVFVYGSFWTRGITLCTGSFTWWNHIIHALVAYFSCFTISSPQRSVKRWLPGDQYLKNVPLIGNTTKMDFFKKLPHSIAHHIVLIYPWHIYLSSNFRQCNQKPNFLRVLPLFKLVSRIQKLWDLPDFFNSAFFKAWLYVFEFRVRAKDWNTRQVENLSFPAFYKKKNNIFVD